eukprot:scaffold44041_cov59-Cyclotella_meneghiniana.AAC.1
MNIYAGLRWDFVGPSKSIDFMNLNYYFIIDNGRFKFALFKKPLNLYLYIPPDSAHLAASLDRFLAMSSVSTSSARKRATSITVSESFSVTYAPATTLRTPFCLSLPKLLTTPKPISNDLMLKTKLGS